MEKFPFEQWIGFIVFIIVALSQIWTSLRENKKKKKNIPSKPRPVNQEPIFEKPLQDLLEALGLPASPSPSPVPQPSSPPPTITKKIKGNYVKEIKPALSAFLQKKEPPIHEAPKPLTPDRIAKQSIPPVFPSRWQLLLKDRNQIQQAIILNEILGKPKGLTYLGS